MIFSRQFFRQRTVFVCLCLLTMVLLMLPLQAKKAKTPKRILSTDPALRMKWYDQHVEMRKTTPHKNMKWQHIGPTNISGRCTDIADRSTDNGDSPR